MFCHFFSDFRVKTYKQLDQGPGVLCLNKCQNSSEETLFFDRANTQRGDI